MENRKELNRTEPDFVVGIDPGVNTGYAVYHINSKRLLTVKSLKIHEAFEYLLDLNSLNRLKIVRVEDARLRTFFTGGKEKAQGVGSIKRDCKIWEDFLTDKGIQFEMIHPKTQRTKVKADTFKNITGWINPTNEHSRDAGMLVFGYNK